MAHKPSYEELQQRIQDLEAQLRDNPSQTQGVTTLGDHFRRIVENTPEGIWVLSPDGRINYLNPRITELFGRTSEQMRGRSLFDVIDRAQAGEMERLLERSRQGTRDRADFSFQQTDGSLLWVSVSTTPLFDDQGSPVGILGVVSDISDRVAMEVSLREGEERFRALFDGCLDAIFLFDPDSGDILDANPAASELIMKPTEEIIRQHHSRLYPAHLQSYALDLFEQLVQDKGQDHPAESHLLRSDGKEVPVEILAQIVQINGMPVLHGMYHDISARQEMELELLKVQKLQALGVLAGGIAHDFNNSLTAIMGNLSMAKTYGDLDTDLAEMLSDAEKASIRAMNLTKQLLTFAKGGEPIKRTASVGHLLKGLGNFFVSGSNVKCEYDIPDNLWTAEIDEGQFSQVMQNLIMNGVEAMPEGGVITVLAENMTGSERDKSPVSPDRCLKISVLDQGEGIPDRLMDKIFDPFFTTKHNRSGLGLSVAYSIIKGHNGDLSVESVPGVGTAFRIVLPSVERETSAKPPGRIAPRMGEEKILVMDNEDILLRTVKKMLERMGYRVETARDGRETIDRYRRAKDSTSPFDLVIMDLTIPGGMGGKEAIKHLREIDPNVKVVVSSGYSHDPVMSKFREYGFNGVIAKPYRMEELAPVLKQVMG